MSLFEFIVGLYVVIAGLGVTLLVRSVGQMLESRDHISFYWVHTCWLGFVFMAHVNSWFTLWEYRDVGRWTIGQFLLLISVPTLLYLASHVSVPEIPEDQSRRYDMREYFYERHRLLQGLLALSMLFNLACEYLLIGRNMLTHVNWIRLLVFSLLLVGIASSDRRLHAAVTIMLLAILAWGMGVLGHPIE